MANGRGFFAEWEAALRADGRPALHIPTNQELEDAAVLLGSDLLLEEADHSRRSIGPHLLPYYSAQAAGQLDEQTRYAATGDHSLVRGLADEAVDALGFDLPLGSAGYATLCDYLNAALLSGMQANRKRNLGELDAEPQGVLVGRVREREAAIAEAGETLEELFDVYAARLLAEKSKRSAGIQQDRMVVAQFADFVGRDRGVGSIRFEDAKAFVDVLPRLPRNYRKRRDYRGLTVREAIEKGERDGVDTLSVITQQRYISTLSPFFDWLKGDKGGRRVTANFFAGLHMDTAKLKRANSYPPLTADQITAIIRSPLFTGFRADGREHVIGSNRADDWRYWLPLLCMFTGARVSEIAQLHVDDIYRELGVWCAELREDEAASQRTKSGKSRSVPLHSTLTRLGFLAFLDRQKVRADRDGERQLFPDLLAGKRGQFGARPSKWFRGYLSAISIKDGRDGLGLHSFRHTMADQLRAAGYLDAIFGPLILGHGSYGMTGGYGQMEQGTLDLMSQMIESVTFIPIHRGRVVEGGKPVDFSHLFDGDAQRTQAP